ncbi:hypothetical protein A2313_02520 [Candidatus Roizmanbacteria bacterium RIFOXYB2_FULL_41_10]|uniref:AAA+ ATPase domain-containing protein n=1 Tax=Candidatus Roizmanbacteria bacterium RIFOXYA1_FULL_41_12 TaxID=1802082 RepID=A0A1F7KA08_9BACT|nr:MAG: hypothetical protein A2209_01250 [Candidatus Roizmanbacteria bacterium RIFOXYA1_FULL_41_12]OGK66703.1 MAG: hypothetical protein A2377_02225 [Candidatus Roizmanbacteria bacterium RIFOXYB1_FULL_41_27]OGK68560.1 MAG: hypothetical protein A2262_04255 [Candidatus Roizmanbacteria bacterium RIFOXYA2_FULL_41_8]OGK70616.1 MAG: hypothetical protein A2313_02520 [Candidatus Roizmanbacteria bacterium RIFOXYB2_FULL_41_10]OGK70923.1 MAG: hypothetical protein A2403_02485 [Candidatus Roizmanbacteria bac
MYYSRIIEPEIKKQLFKNRIIIIYGARRVGKTTLVKKIMSEVPQQSVYLNCDEPDVRQALTNKTSTELINYLGNKTLVIIDEAQRVRNIGLTLKLISDNSSKQIITTGSSSFDLSNQIKEPLTGRAREFYLAPLLLSELHQEPQAAQRLLHVRLRFGTYPEVVNMPEEAQETLRHLYQNYLYKDALEYQGLRNNELIPRLLEALALQIGSQVSYTELGSLLGIDQKTVRTYLRLLELSFVIFTLRPFSRNLRKEISKSRKIYFWDLGIRNAIINNFNPLNLRNDIGALWENFVIAERIKLNQAQRQFSNSFFWRTWTKQEIDYLEEKEGKLWAYEIKWQKFQKTPPKLWLDTYPQASFQVINQENYWSFLQTTHV